MEAENSVTDLLKKYIEVQTQLKLVQTAIFMKDSKDKIAKKTHDMMEFAENQADELLKKYRVLKIWQLLLQFQQQSILLLMLFLLILLEFKLP